MSEMVKRRSRQITGSAWRAIVEARRDGGPVVGAVTYFKHGGIMYLPIGRVHWENGDWLDEGGGLAQPTHFIDVADHTVATSLP